MKRRLLDNGSTVISYREAGGRTRPLVITFDPMHALDPEKPSFGEEFLTGHGYDVVTVQKRRDNWYQDLSWDEFRSAVADIASQYGKVITYGSSMGAYGALYFASAVQAKALSLSPRNPDYYALIGMADYPKQFDLKHVPLRDVADITAQHLVLVDPLHGIDGPYVDREVVPFFPQARIIRMRNSFHPSIQVLNEGGVLKSFVLDFLEGRPVDMVRLRSSRQKSKQYLTKLAEYCAGRGRLMTAARVKDKMQSL